jgi:hypothetical protein
MWVSTRKPVAVTASTKYDLSMSIRAAFPENKLSFGSSWMEIFDAATLDAAAKAARYRKRPNRWPQRRDSTFDWGRRCEQLSILKHLGRRTGAPNPGHGFGANAIPIDDAGADVVICASLFARYPFLLAPVIIKNTAPFGVFDFEATRSVYRTTKFTFRGSRNPLSCDRFPWRIRKSSLSQVRQD